MTTQEKIQWLLNRCKASVTITFNDHLDGYETAQQYFDHRYEVSYDKKEYKNACDLLDISEDDMKIMIERNFVCHVQAYPDTPIGSYSVYHWDFDVALDKMIEAIKN